MRKFATSFRNISTVTVIFGLVLLCFLWAGLYYQLQSERKLEINNTFKETANYARTFEEHTTRTIKGLDLIALSIKAQLEKEGLGIDLFRLLKEERFAGQPFILLGVLNEKGDLIANNSASFVSGINNSDREFFYVHKSIDSGKLFIGKPVEGRGSGKISIQLSRRINKPDGSLGGVVVVSADPNYFAEYYKQINLGEGSSIALVGRDGFVRVQRLGDTIGIGDDFRQNILMRYLSASNVGQFRSPAQVDGVVRLYSYRALNEYPLVVLAGLSEAQALKDYNQRIVGYYWMCGVMSVVIILFASSLLFGINQHRQMEESLIKSEKELRYMADNSSDIIWSLDQEFRFDYISPADSRIRGFARDEVIGTTIWVSLKPEGIEHVKKAYAKRLMDEQNGIRTTTIRHELEQLCKDGSWIWTEINVTPRHDQNGKLIGFHGVTRDISERKNAEKTLQENEDKYRKLFEMESDALFLIDAQSGAILEANAAAIRLYGYSREELLQMRSFDLSTEPEEAKKAGDVAVANGSVVIPIRYHRKKDGTIFPVEINASSLMWKGRQVLIPAIRDITERKKVEAELVAVNLAMQEALQTKSKFLAHMSHELRTPLNAIIGFAEVMQDQLFGPLSNKQKAYVARILNSGQYLLSLVNDLLDISKMEAGKMNLDLEKVNLSRLCRDLIATFKGKAKNRHVALSCVVDSSMDDMCVVLDRRKLKQVMYNLVDNGIKFTQPGGSVSVRIQKTIDNINRPAIQIMVEDTGVGIAEKDIANLFLPFGQLTAQKDYIKNTEGTGLGLALTKQLVELHGGEITVESELGRGSRFVVSIPVQGKQVS